MKSTTSTFLVYHLFLTLLWFTTLISTTHTSAGKIVVTFTKLIVLCNSKGIFILKAFFIDRYAFKFYILFIVITYHQN